MADRLDLAADLHVEIEGTDGTDDVDAHLSGSGSRLVLNIDKPVDAYHRLRQTPDLGRPRDAIAAVARHLDAAGLTVDVVSADTRICSIGSGQGSRFGAVLAGTRLVTPGRIRPVARLLVAAARSGLRTRRGRRH